MLGVADAGAEDKVQGVSKQRIADVSVLPWHRVGFDRALEARPHAEVRAIHEGANHFDAFAKIVGAIGVAHDQKRAGRRLHAAGERRAITWLRDLNKHRAEGPCDQLAPVRAAVVGDEYFTVQAELRPNARERRLGIGDTGGQPFCLV